MQKVDQNDKPYPRHTKTTGSIERQTRVVIAELFWINLDFQNIEYMSKFSFLSPIYTSIKNDDLIIKINYRLTSSFIKNIEWYIDCRLETVITSTTLESNWSND